MKKFTGLTASERETLRTHRSEAREAATLLVSAQASVASYETSLRTKYDLERRDMILTETEEELELRKAELATEKQSALSEALNSASPEERAKYDAWVAAGRPAPKRQEFFPNEE